MIELRTQRMPTAKKTKKMDRSARITRKLQPQAASRSKSARAARSGNQRSKDVHVAILQAAAALVSENGYLKVTVEAIAARAGCSKQTIYRWWPSKADLCIELYSFFADQIIQPADTGTVAGDLRILYAQLLTLFTTTVTGTLLAGLIAEAQSSQRFTNELYSKLVIARRIHWIRLLERARERGEVSQHLDLDFAVDVLSGPVWYRLLMGNAPLDDAFADALVHNLLHGFEVSRPRRQS